MNEVKKHCEQEPKTLLFTDLEYLVKNFIVLKLIIKRIVSFMRGNVRGSWSRDHNSRSS